MSKELIASAIRGLNETDRILFAKFVEPGDCFLINNGLDPSFVLPIVKMILQDTKDQSGKSPGWIDKCIKIIDTELKQRIKLVQ